MILPTPENVLKIREVAYYLQGTCHSLEQGLATEFGDDTSVDDVDIELLRELDDITMECENCNWWCEADELNEDQLCVDCQ